jgi:hypothetical protein
MDDASARAMFLEAKEVRSDVRSFTKFYDQISTLSPVQILRMLSRSHSGANNAWAGQKNVDEGSIDGNGIP